MKKIFITIFTLLNLVVFCQNNDTNKFYIITYKINIKNSTIDENSYYFWIIQKDSLIKSKELRPIFFNETSKNNIDNCLKNKQISIFNDQGTEYFNFDDLYLKELKLIPNIIFRNRVLLAKNIFKSKYNTIVTKVYVTVVSGNFCNCQLNDYDKDILKESSIYLYLNSFKIEKKSKKEIKKNKKLLIGLIKKYYFQ